MRRALALVMLVSALGACAPHPAEPVGRDRRHAPVAPLEREVAAPAGKASEERCGARPAADAREDGAIVLAFAGDVIAHESVRTSARRAQARAPAEGWTENHAGYGAVLAGVRASLRGADLAFVNLESPVTERHTRGGPMVFHAEDALLGALAEAGVGVVSLANNHAYDQGPKGLLDTLDAVQRHGLVGVGAAATRADACRPRLFDVKGIRVALFAQTQFVNFKDDESPSRVCMLDLGPLKRDVKAVRAAGADLVAVSLHWGNEYEAAPRREQVEVARMIVEAGADLLIGHHPHVLQRVERMSAAGREAVVAYSIGNLLSGQAYDYDPDASTARRGDPRDVAVLRVIVEKAPHGEDAGNSSARVREVTAVPLWTEHTDKTIALVPATTRRARIAERLGIPLVDPPTEDDGCTPR